MYKTLGCIIYQKFLMPSIPPKLIYFVFQLILNSESYRLVSNEFTNSNMEFVNLEGFWKEVSRESITAIPAPSPTHYTV